MNRKDCRIQCYYRETQTLPGTTRQVNHRHFIYNKDLYDKGGIYCSTLAMTATDIVAGGLTIDKEPVKFTVNRNPRINNKCKIIWDNVVYDINYIDGFDFRSRQITFVASPSADTTRYGEDRFDD